MSDKKQTDLIREEYILRRQNMNKYTVNGEIKLEAAEGFQLMTAEEIAKLSSGDDSERFGLWDKERHVMFLVDAKKYSGFMLMMTDIQKIAKRNEELNRKLYTNLGYEAEGGFKREVGGLSAEGYRFSFHVENANQSAVCLLVLHGKTVYRFTINGRTENREENEALFAEILDTIEFN
jgi:hypothetical protein